jgi:hypothetical protein
LNTNDIGEIREAFESFRFNLKNDAGLDSGTDESGMRVEGIGKDSAKKIRDVLDAEWDNE